ncbi:radical SAM family heme chaperone HemW [Saprospiraceae bacterium]|nr:radical SAM family heme chaperone HemW [bacterium]MDB4414821.1 radical SAM family heme chaperone HemW [bacterium]MDC3209907.1 radical SAM family heme chaperone HemW [Saprospiraceae bacterium]MDC3253467.1 radical SAM family heme chaperone HemW [bacterium]
MSGIYIHIPFCKQACHYCNFHFSTSMKYKSEIINAILKEIELQKNYLANKNIKTIYFGGGTPSLLNERELNLFFEKINQLFHIEKDAEITLEANPDDLTLEKLRQLKSTPINRLSIGVQSFAEIDLKSMNRAHNVKEAESCIQNAQSLGFNNLTVDLIYGSPSTSNEQWRRNVQKLFDFEIPHLSCYCLTIEPGTALDHFVKRGKAQPVDDEKSAHQFEVLMQMMESNDYHHYEISNFAKPGNYARHNSNYWSGVSYLGVGPSAHSFNGKSRQWNIANNALYLKAIDFDKNNINEKGSRFEVEILSLKQQYNEYIMTALRTMWGCNLGKIRTWGDDFEKYFLKSSEVFLKNGTLKQDRGSFILTKKGKLLADNIAMELFFET